MRVLMIINSIARRMGREWLVISDSSHRQES
jgi:hypothetical protein